jgi:alkanesulfonate monooxygenase SsuD/methylene tetrahydromethanopterin reductase-like flavin-dependent oxidoreductase (luciferase family)
MVGVGLLMPSFGAQATSDRILGTARAAESYGFHSLWVRDHLFIPPGLDHGGIKESGFHLDALDVLGAAAAVTSTIKLGSAVLIPLRHPLPLAQHLATTTFLSGDRMILGLGAGAFAEEFTSIGLDWEKRHRMVQETVEVLRLLADGAAHTYHGEVYDFEDVAIIPPPPRLPIWYGGSGTAVSVKNAFERGYDGWLGLAPADIFDKRLAKIRELSEEHGRTLTVATIPPTSVAANEAAAISPLDQAKIIQSMRHGDRYGYTTFDEVRSALIVGNPEQAAEQITAFAGKGVDVVILDLRVIGDAFDEVFRRIGEEVLPLLKGGD